MCSLNEVCSHRLCAVIAAKGTSTKYWLEEDKLLHNHFFYVKYLYSVVTIFFEEISFHIYFVYYLLSKSQILLIWTDLVRIPRGVNIFCEHF